MNIDNLEKMIQQYSKELLEMGKAYGGEAEKEEPVLSVHEKLPLSDGIQNEKAPDESSEGIAGEEASELSEAEPLLQNDTSTEPLQEAESNSTATFSARVFAAEGAYPVGDAKVVVYKGDKIYAFLVTDENGTTKTVTIPAFNRVTSEQKEQENATADYLADVFAKGFESKKGLTVSAEGQSEIVLDVLLTPESERIS